MRSWVNGRVILIGDAAHLTMPNLPVVGPELRFDVVTVPSLSPRRMWPSQWKTHMSSLIASPTQ